MVENSLNIISLCSGGGGLDSGLKLAIGATARVVCYVERETYSAAVLDAAINAGAMDDAPIWDCARHFDGKPWRGVVDFIIGGIPCQPWSVAGKRHGKRDRRDLWPDTWRIIKEAQPSFVFIENVPGILVPGGLDRIVTGLEWLDFTVAAGLFSAEEVGAPHKRERVFILAKRNSSGCSRARTNIAEGDSKSDGRHDAGRRSKELGNTGCCGDNANESQRVGGCSGASRIGETGSALAVTHCGTTLEQRAVSRSREKRDAAEASGAMADTGCVGCGSRDAGSGWQERAEAVNESETVSAIPGATAISLFPPGPSNIVSWRRILAIDSTFAPAIESQVCNVANGLAHRSHQLRLAGNGVVPLVAAYAFISLFACLHGGKLTSPT